MLYYVPSVNYPQPMQKYLFILLFLIFSCDEPAIEGCTTSTDCNYNINADKDDGSCVAPEGCNEWCAGDTTIVLELDCIGECGGLATIDSCNVCSGGTTSFIPCIQDCNDEWGGTAWASDCGCVAVDNSGDDCDDCAGTPNGDAEEDICGVCNGDGTSCYGCTSPSACNFDANATIFDDSCWYATEGCACSDGEGSVADECGTCDTDASNDCGWQVQFEASDDLFGLYFVDINTGFAVGRDGLILKTIDGGSNWTSIDGGTSKLLWGIYFVDVNTGWAVGLLGTIIKTTDGGESWSDQTILGVDDLRDVFFIDTNTGWVVGNNDIIYKTIDGGSNWTNQATGTEYSFQGVYCIDSNICMVTGIDIMASNESIIFRTTDGGINWVLNYVSDGYLREIYFHENTGWVVGSPKYSASESPIINSNDGGLTWSEQSSGIFDTNLNDVYFVDENKGWAVGSSGTIIKTIDGGTMWDTQQSNTDIELRAVHFINNKGWAAGQGGGFILRYIE